MNKPETKKNRKILLLLFAVVIGLSSLVYTNILVKRLQIEEKQKIELRIEATKQLIKATGKLSRNNKSGLIFLSQKNAVISTQQLNRLLKIVFASLLPTHCISTHSLRKTFGRRVYENNGRTEDALNYLSEIFNHASLRETRKYLGIRQEELNEIYLNL
jgi:site-specific recombinase XerD